MASSSQSIVLPFSGGYATDLPSQTRELQYFLKAENVIYEVSGAVRKVGGAEALNASAITDSPDVVGLFDYWRAGTVGSFTQKLVAVTGDGKIYKDDGDGVFDLISDATSHVSNNVVPVFCQMRDLLTIWTSANDTPLKWDGITGTAQLLGGSPPAGRGCCFHLNRGWAWGTLANPSTVYYSDSTNVEIWSGSDTGSFEFDPQDGDIVIGAISYKGNLIVFKGPNKGAIFVIGGTDVTTFTKTKLVSGIALQTPNAIVAVGDDILFMSDRGIHSLSAVQQYGSFATADLTRFLKGHFRTEMNKNMLSKVWGVDYSEKSCVIWTYTGTGGAENNTTLGLSYIRFQEEGFKPFIWTRGGLSAAIRINPANRVHEVVYGTTDGYVMREDVTNRSLPNNTSYAMRVLTPLLLLGKADAHGAPRGDQPVVIHNVYLRSVASGNHNINMTIVRDDSEGETYQFNQGLTGFVLDESLLDEGTLGAGAMQISYADMPIGEARAIQFDITQNGVNEDANMLEIGVEIKPTGLSTESTLTG